MKSQHREAARGKARLQDAYIDGTPEDDALETQQWYDEHMPQYEASEPDHHLDQQLPF